MAAQLANHHASALRKFLSFLTIPTQATTLLIAMIIEMLPTRVCYPYLNTAILADGERDLAIDDFIYCQNSPAVDYLVESIIFDGSRQIFSSTW